MWKTWLLLGTVALLALSKTSGPVGRPEVAWAQTKPGAWGVTAEKSRSFTPGKPSFEQQGNDGVRAALEKLPLYFIENRGQLDSRVGLYLQGASTSVYFTSKNVTIALTGVNKSEAEQKSAPSRRWAVKLDFVDANLDSAPIGREETAAVVSYFKGKQTDWETGLRTYRSVVYPDLWPGIDLVYTGTAGRLKYTFVVHPGADPSRIQLSYRGATEVRLTEEGRIDVSTPLGGFEDDVPYAYQEAGDERVEVPTAYRELERTEETYRYGFHLGPYDKSKPLIVDPAVLAYCGYIGGTGWDEGEAVAVDGSGYAYVTGSTGSSDASFPVNVGPDVTHNTANDAFVAKVTPDGTSLVYCGYIGGSADDHGYAIAVDGSGNAYVGGDSQTSDGSFPVTVGSMDTTYNLGLNDAFVAKVNAAGTGLDYCGYIGGSGIDTARDIAVDSAGNAYVTGETSSTEASFPETAGSLDTTHNGGLYDVFVAKVNASGTALTYCGYIGGGGDDWGDGIALDSSENAYVTGRTTSDETTFPETAGSLDTTHNGGSFDAFIAKVNAAGTALTYCGYIGGSADDEGYAVAVDDSGNAYVAGLTRSDEGSFPVTVGPDLTHNSAPSADAFVAKVNAAGTGLDYCGYIGGAASEAGNGIAVNGSGNAYVTGYTGSSDFPVTVGPDLTFNGGADVFVAKLDPTGSSFVYSGYIGGPSDDRGRGIAVDSNGDAYVVGLTDTMQPYFPVWAGPELVHDGGTRDAFVAKIVIIPDVLKLIGFETADLTEISTPGSGVAVDPIQTRLGSGLWCLRQLSDASVVADGLPQLSTIGLRFSFRKPSDPGLPQTIVEFTNGVVTTGLWALQLRIDGALQVQDLLPGSLGLQGTLWGSTPLANDVWYTVRIAYDAAAGGILKVWLDESLEIDATHTNAGTSIEAFQVDADTAAPLGYRFDDFYLINSAIQPPLGQIIRIGPNGPGNVTQFDSEEPIGSTHWQNVNELPPDDLNNYNYHTASTVMTDLYSLDDVPSSAVNAVKGMWHMKRGTGSGAGTHDYAWRVDGYNASAEFIGIDTNWARQEIVWTVPPEGNGVWTDSRVNALELGATHNGTHGQDTYLSWTAAMVDYDSSATAVELVSFTAKGFDGEVRLEWETGSELDNMGFHIYRALSEEGPYERITTSIIPGLGSSPEGAHYSYRDTGLTNGVEYYYKLEDVETNGRTELHGPVSAIPQVGEIPESGSDGSSEQNSVATTITYGEPSRNTFRVVSRDENQVVLKLRTEGFYAEPQPDGTVRIEVPGFDETEDGLLAVPVKRASVEAIAGRKVQLASVRSMDEDRVEGLRPSGKQTEVEATPRGTVRLQRSRQVRRHIARSTGWYPEQAARVVSLGFQGDVKKALVELAPIRWDGKALVLARELEVRLLFHGREVSERSLEGRRGRRYRRRRSQERRAVGARLVTKERGLYGIGLEQVLGRAYVEVDPSRLRLSRQGETVSFHVEDSTLYFMSEGAPANPYGPEAVYELEVGVPGEQMAVSEARPQGESIGHLWHRVEREENHVYQPTLLDAPDSWLWDYFFAPMEKSYPFEVRGLASCSEPSRIEVWLQGASDFAANPDHHVRLYVNGHFVGEASFEGKQPLTVESKLLPGILYEGENLLEIENVGDTEADHSMLLLDRYRVVYPRVLEAEDGVLEGEFRQSGVAEVGGLPAGGFVLDITEKTPQWLRGAELNEAGRLRFRVEDGRTYLATTPESVLSPDVRRVLASTLKNKGKGADYVVIGPDEFLYAAEPLLELRRSQGLRVESVSIEAVYSEFGFGESTPEAVRDFLAYAYHQWRAPSIRYVLLLGDGTYDPKDYLGTGVQNRVPPYTVRTRYLWTASDPAYGAVNGEDNLPDLAIGRVPAASLEELRVMVDKIVSFETDATSTSAPVVLVTDNPDRAGDFDANADELASSILSGQRLKEIHLSRLGTAATQQAIVDAFNEGASLLSYIGHGGIHLWADENLFNIWQVDALSAQTQQPLVLTMNCLNGYFHFPYFDSLAEKLLKAEGKGAIAVFSPSGLSLNTAAHHYHKALLTEIFHGGHERLGDAVLAAQEVYAESGAHPDLLSIYHLFGDPAMKLR